jgi:hypothetical protein
MGKASSPTGELLKRRLQRMSADKRQIEKLLHMIEQHDEKDIETLDLQTGYTHGHNQKEYVRVGAPSGGYISLVVVHFDQHWNVNARQAVLTIDEADAVIQGLTEAKRRILERQQNEKSLDE